MRARHARNTHTRALGARAWVGEVEAGEGVVRVDEPVLLWRQPGLRVRLGRGQHLRMRAQMPLLDTNRSRV